MDIKSNVKIRRATVDDAKDILNIYSHYVINTAITFECDVPAIEEFRYRIKKITQKYPYFVAEVPNDTAGNEIIGYAYAGSFVGRAAYDWSAELTIYINPNFRNRGIGGSLYRKLENVLKDMGVLNLYACVAYPPNEKEDEYLTMNSVNFHEHLGFKIIGRFHNCGHKFNRWYDMVWMEKIIGEHKSDVLPVRFYNQQQVVNDD